MSDDLLRRLRFLEDDFIGMPTAIQRSDLKEINQIRTQLGMPLVDAQLKPIGLEEDAEEEVRPEPEAEPDFTEARQIYAAYLEKLNDLEVHRAYAEQVAMATKGRGQTPVRPLATMGIDGGPLLCDHCRKPIVLEGGDFHGVAADTAWKKKPKKNWTSWILGGMVVEIETNGTLRIFHGYPERNPSDCCNIAGRKEEQARAEFGLGKCPEKRPLMRAFIEKEFAEMTREQQSDLLNNILDIMFEYDPGIGINRPGT